MGDSVTLARVAAAAGVSKAAASMALFGGAGNIRVSEKTTERIRKTAQLLKYRPNRSARSLSLGKTRSVGILFGAIYDLCRMELAVSIQQLLLRQGYIGIIAGWSSDEDFSASLRTILDHNVDGIIVAHQSEEYPRNIPVISYVERHEHRDYVSLDTTKRVERSVAYLSSLGHEKIGYVEKDKERQWFEDAMRHASLPVNPDWILSSDGFFGSGVRAARQFLRLSDMPTAIIARNDVVAISMIADFQKQGVRVPDEISVIGFDDITPARYITPCLTTFDISLGRSAELLVDTMLTRLENHGAPQIKHEIVPKLVVRDSCAKPRQISKKVKFNRTSERRVRQP